MNIHEKIDATNLKPNASSKDIQILCELAIEQQFAAVCVAPSHAMLTSKLLSETPVKSCAVVGFPYGYSFSDTKVLEAQKLIEIGVQEIDFVINLTFLSDLNFGAIHNETKAIVSLCQSNQVVSKWIIECDYTRPYFGQIIEMANQLKPDYVKTSSGLLGGARVEDLMALRHGLHPAIQLKASGGIQTRSQAIEMIHAGANRIGTSNPLFT